MQRDNMCLHGFAIGLFATLPFAFITWITTHSGPGTEAYHTATLFFATMLVIASVAIAWPKNVLLGIVIGSLLGAIILNLPNVLSVMPQSDPLRLGIPGLVIGAILSWVERGLLILMYKSHLWLALTLLIAVMLGLGCIILLLTITLFD